MEFSLYVGYVEFQNIIAPGKRDTFTTTHFLILDRQGFLSSIHDRAHMKAGVRSFLEWLLWTHESVSAEFVD